jgi:hypothetical protein
MRIAYADPPYFGYAGFYSDHPGHKVWDSIEAHRDLAALLSSFDGWALSLTSGNLYDILPLFPSRPRIAAWVKPFASFKPNVNPAYTWEPVIFSPDRKGGRDRRTVRDHVSSNITLRRGLTGAKPEAFCLWLFDLLGADHNDEFVDLFPGTGVGGRSWKIWREYKLRTHEMALGGE